MLSREDVESGLINARVFIESRKINALLKIENPPLTIEDDLLESLVDIAENALKVKPKDIGEVAEDIARVWFNTPQLGGPEAFGLGIEDTKSILRDFTTSQLLLKGEGDCIFGEVVRLDWRNLLMAVKVDGFYGLVPGNKIAISLASGSAPQIAGTGSIPHPGASANSDGGSVS